MIDIYTYNVYIFKCIFNLIWIKNLNILMKRNNYLITISFEELKEEIKIYLKKEELPANKIVIFK